MPLRRPAMRTSESDGAQQLSGDSPLIFRGVVLGDGDFRWLAGPRGCDAEGQAGRVSVLNLAVIRVDHGLLIAAVEPVCRPAVEHDQERPVGGAIGV